MYFVHCELKNEYILPLYCYVAFENSTVCNQRKALLQTTSFFQCYTSQEFREALSIFISYFQKIYWRELGILTLHDFYHCSENCIQIHPKATELASENWALEQRNGLSNKSDKNNLKFPGCLSSETLLKPLHDSVKGFLSQKGFFPWVAFDW